MKRNVFYSYVSSIRDYASGQSYGKITRYFLPEFVTAVLLYSLPLLIDARFIAHLKCTSSYATLGVTNTILHFIIKMAEGISIGAIVLTGQFNGNQEYKKAGDVLTNAFWTTVLVGGVISSLLFLGAPALYRWYEVPADMAAIGIPFLRIRAIGILFAFIYFGLVGFLRGVKENRIPMLIFMVGCAIFLVADYILIFGVFGFPALGLSGSAYATVIQYVTMSVLACAYVLYHPKMKQYGVSLFSGVIQWGRVKEICHLSWPVMIDKGTLALSYMWLGKCFAPMGTCILASFAAIRDLQCFALLPAIAFAQVITFLVSNDCGREDWYGIKVTIKRVLFLSACMVLTTLFFCSLCPVKVIRIFDMKDDFTEFAAKAFPIISVFKLFDIIQLILSGALRGAANVKTVMWTRLCICLFFFFPVTYLFSQMDTSNQLLKFVLIYSTLYISNAFMCLIYIKRFRGHEWEEQAMRNRR